MSLFAGQVAILGTKHGKEAVIAPCLATVGVEVTVAPGLDTDQLGTFSRERPRLQPPQATARVKAEQALALSDADLALASEGSFAPHPQMPWVVANRELVLLYDPVRNLELVGETLSLETNFAHTSVTTLTQALSFADQIGFPSHALIVMPQAQPLPHHTIHKGITTPEALEAAVTQAMAQSETGTIHLETDMRACYNPTRMQVIAQATENLITAMTSLCPQCECPGFTLKDYQPGLACSACGWPTLLPKWGIYRCDQCGHQHRSHDPKQLVAAAPSECPQCNP